MASPCEVIGKNLFKKETNIQLFLNLKVSLSTGEIGIIESSFGQSGKVKIRFMENLKEETQSLLSSSGSKKKKPLDEKTELVRIILSFKRYIYDPHKKIIQN